MTVEGTISVEGAQLPPGYLRVVLDPVGAGNELSTEVRSDGTFTIGSVASGQGLANQGLELPKIHWIEG